MLWLERALGPVPVEFARLVEAIVTDSAARESIDALLAAKRRGLESDYGPRIPVIHDFVEREYARLQAGTFALEQTQPDPAPLNELFQQWGGTGMTAIGSNAMASGYSK